MDATRTRRTRDGARRAWYARHRQRRFARYLGFVNDGEYPWATHEGVGYGSSPDALAGRAGPAGTLEVALASRGR